MQQSIVGLIFCFATGIALACYYTLNKKVTHAGSALQIIFWIFAAHLPPLLIWVSTKNSMAVDWWYLPPGIGVLALTVAGNFFAVRALSLSPFSLMIPVMSLSPVFTSLIGIPLLNEWPTITQWMGISLAVLGVMGLYAPPERPWDIFSFWAQFFRERGAPSMATSALCWSLSAPMDKLALRHADPAFHALFVFSGLVIFLFIWLSLRGEWRIAPIPRSFWPMLAATGAAGAAADILQLFALMHTHAGTLEAIKRVISQLLATLLAYFIFKESLTRAKMIGIGVICVGVPMIVL